MEAGKPEQKEARTRAVIFEALFQRGLKLDDTLEAGLRNAGFDVRDIKLDYPNTVFVACLDVAWKQRFPAMTREQAHWQLGKLLVKGFGDTMLGKVVQASLPMLGTMRVLRRFPTFMSIDATNLTMKFEEVGPKYGRLICTNNPHNVPEFTAGCVEGSLEMTGAKPQVTLQRISPTLFNLDVRW